MSAVAATRAGHSIVSATVRPMAVGTMLEELRAHGVPEDDIRLTRLEIVGRAATGRVETSLVWEDVLGMAWVNSRPVARYVAFNDAGVVACYGVIDRNAILIVGAMAVSPDLLPIVATAVGVVGRRVDLAVRAAVTLVVGLAVASATAAACTFGQDHLGYLPSGFDLQATGVLGGLTSVSNETVVVALAGWRRGDARDRDPGERRRGRGDLGDDDPRCRLPGRGHRARRARDRVGCPGRARRQHRHADRRIIGHARPPATAAAPRRGLGTALERYAVTAAEPPCMLRAPERWERR